MIARGLIGGRHDDGGDDGRSMLRRRATPESDTAATRAAVDRFADDQMFEEDVRAVIAMMRPHRRERLLGWTEYRTGGANFRATISWNRCFERGPQTCEEQCLSVPRLTDVLECILVGSVKEQDELTAAQEFDIYRGVLRELYRRLDEMQARYD